MLQPPPPARRRVHPEDGRHSSAVMLAGGVTLTRLLMGLWSVVLASQGEFVAASGWIVLAGVLDALDGGLARMTGAVTALGTELDILTDLVCFGVAPAAAAYWLTLQSGYTGAWVVAFAYAACTTVRLARCNVRRGVRGHCPGLTSPVAGMTIAGFIALSRATPVAPHLTGLLESGILLLGMTLLSVAMLSRVDYQRLPQFDIRGARPLARLVVALPVLVLGMWQWELLCFPLAVVYLLHGGTRAMGRFLARRPVRAGSARLPR